MQVVVAPSEQHRQRLASSDYDGALSGELRTPASLMQPLGLSVRKVIAHRCMLEIDAPYAIVNLGVGMPEVLTHCSELHNLERTEHHKCWLQQRGNACVFEYMTCHSIMHLERPYCSSRDVAPQEMKLMPCSRRPILEQQLL